MRHGISSSNNVTKCYPNNGSSPPSFTPFAWFNLVLLSILLERPNPIYDQITTNVEVSFWGTVGLKFSKVTPRRTSIPENWALYSRTLKWSDYILWGVHGSGQRWNPTQGRVCVQEHRTIFLKINLVMINSTIFICFFFFNLF